LPLRDYSRVSNSKIALAVLSGASKIPQFSLAGPLSFKKQVYNERMLDKLFFL
jgi:hypothetical protein